MRLVVDSVASQRDRPAVKNVTKYLAWARDTLPRCRRSVRRFGVGFVTTKRKFIPNAGVGEPRPYMIAGLRIDGVDDSSCCNVGARLVRARPHS